MLIPGCGSAYEVEASHDAGHDVAIDFSPAALEHAKKVLGVLGERVILGDFFTYDFGERRFDLIYERIFLCSMAPWRRRDYVNRMADLLSPEGKLVGIFLYGQELQSGPPFPISDAQADQLFTTRFQLMRNDSVTDSVPLFRDMERWQEWRKIDCYCSTSGQT